MPSPLQISERQVGDVVVLGLQGHLWLDQGATLLSERIDALVREGRVNIVLDLQDVSHVDSCGIGSIIGKYLSVRRCGGDLKLLHLSEHCHRLMAVTHLLSIFEAYESEDEAIRSFSVQQRRQDAS